MASVDELSTAINVGKEAIEQSTASIAAAMTSAEELSNQFTALGAEDKASMSLQVKEGLEQVQGALASLTQTVEAAQAQAESLRGN